MVLGSGSAWRLAGREEPSSAFSLRSSFSRRFLTLSSVSVKLLEPELREEQLLPIINN
jgi:hypothetical protein